MTTFEHAMLGTTGALALGLHHRGWQLGALAGVAAVLPDWDGLSIVFGASTFDRVHRAVGHSIFVATLLAVAVAVAEYRLGLLDRVGAALARRVEGVPIPLRNDPTRGAGVRAGPLLWAATAILATWSHLAADVIFSGHAKYSDWGLKLLWPVSQRAFVFPLIRWGDPMPTIVLVAGMFAMLRWRSRVQSIAALTLCALVGYIAFRALLVPY